MNAALRVYRPEDFEQLYEIDQACYPPGVAYSRRTLRRFLGLRGADCVVAEGDKKILGFIVSHRRGPEAHIITIDVLEPHRRRGFGSALLHEAESCLAARGVGTVSLETATDNAAAVAFWQKHGYRTHSLLQDYYPGLSNAFFMTKALTGSEET